ncbi:MAG: hypothetical protein M3Y85_12265 [Bacteroidota bacterium]|nr:hypothetical protein [Bacteroidota bacterium]
MTSKVQKPLLPKIKSGKLPYVHDPRTLHLSDYLSWEPSVKIPQEYNWGRKIHPDKWSSFGNLKINDCTCAAAGHLIMTWTGNIGRFHRPTTRSIVKAYTDITGFNPKTDGIGKPVEAIKALKYWRKHGIDNHKIIAFAKLSFKNREQLKQAIYLYGGCYVGLNLPKSAEKQYNESKKWTVPRNGANGVGEPGSWIGHALSITGYSKNELTAISWGKEIIMSLDFWEKYVDESYAVFSSDFVRDDHTPTKIKIDVLRKDVAILQNKKAGLST